MFSQPTHPSPTLSSASPLVLIWLPKEPQRGVVLGQHFCLYSGGSKEISKYQTFLPKIPHKDIFVWYQMAFLWAPNKTFCSIWNMSSVCWVQFKFTYSFILHSTFHKYKIRQPRSVSKQKLHAFVNIHSIGLLLPSAFWPKLFFN